MISNLSEGQVLEGVVKNITDYGAFVDLGGVDGLLHVTDIAWRRVNHPSEALQIGQTVKVQVIRFNAETQRISLGMKQLETDPWEGVEAKYPSGTKFTGRVTNITDYGAFVELEPGVEGLVHVSEMSWTKKNIHPGKIVSTSQEVEVMVLDADPEKRRISLGLKQCQSNPWEGFLEKFTVGSEVEGEVKNITEFGLFIGLEGQIDGMAHLSDLSWKKSGEEALADYKKGDMVKAKVLDVDVEKERISLGVKQLPEDTVGAELGQLKKGTVVTCTISKIVDTGIEVMVNDITPGFIRKGDLSRDRSEQRPDRFATGEKVDAKITQIDKAGRKLTLSIKALEVEEEKKAIIQVIESESAAFWNKNYNEWSSYWVQESYIRTMGWWEAGGVTVVEGWNERAKRMKEHMEESPEPNPTASNVNRVNINIRIFEDVAWLTFDQYGEDTGDTLMDMPGLSRETRILESMMINGKLLMLDGYSKAQIKQSNDAQQ